jgi:hypothetical protein
MGRTSDARRILTIWWTKHGKKIKTARYYHAFLKILLFGAGDWETASRVVYTAGWQQDRWRTSYDHASFAEMCRIYYNNIHFSDYEMRRIGADLQRKRYNKLRALSGLGPAHGL